MNLENKMQELKLQKRELVKNNDYQEEYFTFNKADAIKAMCYLIDNANKSIEIHHKAILDENNEKGKEFDKHFEENPVIQSLKNNKIIAITYYTSGLSKEGYNKIKKDIGNHIDIQNIELPKYINVKENKECNMTYHHKEMNIDNKYTIITSMNFLTNTSTEGVDVKSSHWLENFSIWVKKGKIKMIMEINWNSITEFIENACTKHATLLTNIIYGCICIISIIIVIYIVVKKLQIWGLSKIIKIKTNKEELTPVEQENNIKLENKIKKHFPIFYKEIEEIYNNPKPKQISAIDICENYIVIPAHEEMLVRTFMNSLTPLGLLGTFIGLMNSIGKIENLDATKITNSIDNLITAIGPAITTTIIGVFASIMLGNCFTLLKAHYKKIAIKLEKEIMQDKPEETNPDYFYDSFKNMAGEKYDQALGKIVDSFVDKMDKKLAKDFNAYKTQIDSTVESLNKHEQQFTTAAGNLTTTVADINSYLTNTNELNTKFKTSLNEFTEALNKFDANLQKINKTSKETSDHIKTISDTNLELNKATLTTLKIELAEIKNNFDIIKDINIAFRNELLQAPTQLNDSVHYVCEQIKEASGKVNKIPEDLQKSVTNLCTTIQNVSTNFDFENSNKTIDKISNNLEIITKEIKKIENNKKNNKDSKDNKDIQDIQDNKENNK